MQTTQTQTQIGNTNFEIFSQKASVSIDTGNVESRKHGAPYIAMITGTDEQYGLKREFLGNKIFFKGLARVTLKGEFPVGTIFEVRKEGSWKNECRYFYIVTRMGLGVKNVDIDSTQRIAEVVQDKEELLKMVLRIEKNKREKMEKEAQLKKEVNSVEYKADI